MAGRIRRLPPARPAFALPLFGLATFTFFCVTARWPELFSELGIYIALLGLLLRPTDLSFPTPVRWAAVFLLWALLTIPFSISPETASAALIERLKALVIFFVVVNCVRTPQQLRFYILLTLVAFLIYPARGTLVGYVTGSNTVFGRAIWNRIYANPNDLGAITLLMLGWTLAIAVVKKQNLWVRRAAAVCVPLLVTIMLLTQSRGVFIGLIVGFGPALLTRVKKRPSIAGPVLMVLGIVAVLVPASSWQRLGGIAKLTSTPSTASSTTASEADPKRAAARARDEGSAAQRLEIAKVAWHIFTNNPLLGVGIGCYREANGRFAPELGERDAHNTYLNLAAETGIPGLVLWLGLITSVLAQLRRRRHSLEGDDSQIGVLWMERALIGFLVAAVFATYSGITIFYLFLGTVWAAASMLGRAAIDSAASVARRPIRAH